MRFLIRVLNCEEIQECLACAYERFRQLKLPPESPVVTATFEDEVMLQLLARACRDCDRPDEMPFAVDADDMRRNTTVDERAIVFSFYRDFQTEVDPTPGELSSELMQAITSAVKKKDRAALLVIGSCALASYLLTGAHQPVS
ncbi:MAG: hypothetical protein V2A73_14800 [Pseudomonadota bacterium]